MGETATVEEISVESAASPPQLTFDQISVRAYEIHIAGEGGDDVDDWLRAERELLAQVGADRHSDDLPQNGGER